jgi:hypothetical protein
LFYAHSSEAINKLRHRQIDQIHDRHGRRTPNLLSAYLPTRVRSSQLFPRRYSRGERPSKFSFLVEYHALNCQCFKVGIGTTFSGASIILAESHPSLTTVRPRGADRILAHGFAATPAKSSGDPNKQ